jgi:hypothetical protein
LKLTTKKKPAAESKKSKSVAKEDSEPVQPEEPPMTEEEKREKRKKTGVMFEQNLKTRTLTRIVLYLRHRLQKGFLIRGVPPKAEDMPGMSAYMTQLEELGLLEPEIIKETKVHKVLKGILKLGPIPLNEEFNITARSEKLLNQWGTLNAGDDAAEATAALATNGVKPEETKADEPAAEKAAPAITEDVDGDVAMAESAPEPKDNAPAAETNGDAEADKAADAMEAVA